jgi:predicted PurR-regulated permease PerM
MCHLLTWFQGIIVPFFFSLFFMYLMDPMVSLLVKTPRGCWVKFAKKNAAAPGSQRFLTPIFGRSRARWGGGGVGGGGGGGGVASPLVPDGGGGGGGTAGSVQQPRRGGGAAEAEPRRCCCGCSSTPPRCCRHPLLNLSMPRWMAVVFSLGFAVLVVMALCAIVSSSVLGLENNSAKYELGWSRFVNNTAVYLRYFDLSWDKDVEPQLVTAAETFASAFFFNTLEFAAKAAVTLVFLVYLSLSPIRPKAGIWGKIDRQVRRYIRLKTFICLIVGTLVGVALAILGVDLAWMFALITFVANYVPNVGPVFATFVPLPLVILDPDLTVTAKTLAFVLPLFVHMIVGNIVEPRLFGNSLDLHPIIVLLSLAFWAILWGVAGMILAVPLIAVMRIILSHLDHPYAATAVRVLEGRFFAGQVEESFRGTAADSMTSSLDPGSVASKGYHPQSARDGGAEGGGGGLAGSGGGGDSFAAPGDAGAEQLAPPGLFLADANYTPVSVRGTPHSGAAADGDEGGARQRPLSDALRSRATQYGTA